ncbi:allantoinase, mitochondrial-like [Branchiostoma floridae x Branchiostoma belcheri]
MASQRNFDKVVRGQRVVLPDEICPAEICIKDGVIAEIRKGSASSFEAGVEVIDAGDLYVMPGVVDSHVHVNEPGRTEWEGYVTATRAAAAGGITTIVDMPLNSVPSTTTLAAFQTKLDTARDKLYVDVAFWGGVVPGNEGELQAMIAAGISGFKCFLIHSGVDEFQHVTEPDLHRAMQALQGTNSVLLFHAEVDQPIGTQTSTSPQAYQTFLQSRPKAMENHAIQLVSDMCQQYGVRCHIVHLSSAEALPIIRTARQRGLPLTVETCHHYLTLCAEDIPDRATQFKCCPPIRERNNQEELWDALKARDIDMVVSDHSPCTADLKLLDTGDFVAAWGGVASVQFGLSLFWTNAAQRNLTVRDLVDWMCVTTSDLCGMGHRKGSLEVGKDADLVIWDPDGTFTVTEDIIQHKNKVTPYLDRVLKGVVHRTLVRGNTVFDSGTFSSQPMGTILLKPTTTSAK